MYAIRSYYAAVGYLLALGEGEPEGLKEVQAVLDEAPLFPPELVPFLVRAADYYSYNFV